MLFLNCRYRYTHLFSRVLYTCEVGFLATFGALGAAKLIGVGFSIVTETSVIESTFFGAIMAATDPIGVSEIFRGFTFGKD